MAKQTIDFEPGQLQGLHKVGDKIEINTGDGVVHVIVTSVAIDENGNPKIMTKELQN